MATYAGLCHLPAANWRELGELWINDYRPESIENSDGVSEMAMIGCAGTNTRVYIRGKNWNMYTKISDLTS